MSILSNLFQDIADAIREKTGSTDKMSPAAFPQAISDIQAGSGETVETETLSVPLDMTGDGGQIIVPSEGKLLSQVVIEKPDTLIPENIAGGVDIGGIIGTLTGGGGAKFAHNYFVPSTAIVTITHNLGVVPDFVYVLCAEASTTGKIVSAHSYGPGRPQGGLIPNTAARLYGTSKMYNSALYLTDSNSAIHDADKTTFQVGSSTYTLQTSKVYYWVAIGGIF